MRIAIIGDFDHRRRSRIATSGCLEITSRYLSMEIVTEWIPTLSLEVDQTHAGLEVL